MSSEHEYSGGGLCMPSSQFATRWSNPVNSDLCSEGPKVLGPEVHVATHPLLYIFSIMGLSPVLLKYILVLVGLLHGIGDLWDHIFFQCHQVVGHG
uniref:Uncharacterized protein n=1 Tax=Lepeophtheirus salmonis TaxID=72036 RepID=A0A0K2T6L7_LEPSM